MIPPTGTEPCDLVHTCTLFCVTTGQTRAQRKEQTRQALLDATLELSTDRGFANVSLREIARAAGLVPTAFYRHFESLDQLGLAIVEVGMSALRVMLREARRSPGPANARQSLEILSKHVGANRELFRFIYRERFGGSTDVRNEIASELDLIVRELTVDLARMPGLGQWPSADLDMAADLLVSAMIQAMGAMLDAGKPGHPREHDIIERSEKQMRLIILGMAAWQPKD